MNSLSPMNTSDLTTYLAAERTLLAWIRTGIALMGFGFVVARFGIFLRELASTRGNMPPPHTSASLWIGTLLVVLGVVVNLAAAHRHRKIVQQLQQGSPVLLRRLSLATVVAFVLALLGLGLAFYLTVDLR